MDVFLGTWEAGLNTRACDWLGHLKNVLHLSEATIRSYRVDLAAWQDFLAGVEVSEEDASSAEARIFMSRMSSSGMEIATVNRRLSAIRGYYEWCRRKFRWAINPFADARTIRRGRRLPGYLTYQEIESLLEASGDGFAGFRNRALFELLYSTGCRVGEICSLDLGDVSNRQTTVSGKKGRKRVVFIGAKAASVLADYLPRRLEHVAEDSDSQRALLLNLRGKRITSRGVYYLTRRYAELANVAKRVSPHTFRHSFATHVVDEGVDIRMAQELLGHANLSTTQIYTHTGIERIKQKYRQSHPHARAVKKIGGADV